MREQIAERRQTEEMTSSVLRTIEDTLGTILDRVDRLDPGGFELRQPSAGERHEGTLARSIRCWRPMRRAHARSDRSRQPPCSTPPTTPRAGSAPGRPPEFDRSQEPTWKEPEVADTRGTDE